MGPPSVCPLRQDSSPGRAGWWPGRKGEASVWLFSDSDSVSPRGENIPFLSPSLAFLYRSFIAWGLGAFCLQELPFQNTCGGGGGGGSGGGPYFTLTEGELVGS